MPEPRVDEGPDPPDSPDRPRPAPPLPPLPPEAPPQLRDALADFLANRGSRDAAEHFRSALCAYVKDLRAADVPPERVLVIVKRLLHGTPPAVADEAVVWCVGAYFDPH